MSAPETVWTKGPWTLDAGGVPILRKGTPGSLIRPDYHCITAGSGYHPGGFELTGFMSEASACLIAAAPDLYEALIDIAIHAQEHGLGRDPSDDPVILRAKAALAKARGGQ